MLFYTTIKILMTTSNSIINLEQVTNIVGNRRSEEVFFFKRCWRLSQIWLLPECSRIRCKGIWGVSRVVAVFVVAGGDRLSGQLYRESYCGIHQRFCFYELFRQLWVCCQWWAKLFAVVGLDEFIKDNYRIAFRIRFLIRILLVVS